MIALCWAAGERTDERQTAAALCDALLQAAFALPDPAAVLRREESGRPRLTLPGADLSISHSAGAALVALSVRGSLPPLMVPGATVALLDEEADAIGVDLEAVEGQKEARCLRVARRFFTPREAARLEALPSPEERVRAFLTLWTRKESAVKATGEGLRALRSVDTEASPPGCRFLTRELTIAGRPYCASVCLLKNA